MLKISESVGQDGGTIVKLEGQVTGAWVTEVREYCRRLLDTGLLLTLDVGEVSFLDSKGVALFKELRMRRVTLVNCDPFLTELLKTAAP